MMLPTRKLSAKRLVFAIFGICLTYFILRREYLLSQEAISSECQTAWNLTRRRVLVPNGLYMLLYYRPKHENAFSTYEDKSQGRHLTYADNTVHYGYQINETQLLNDKFLIRNSIKHVERANPNIPVLQTDKDKSNDIQIANRNSSIKKYQKKVTNNKYDKSSTINLDIVPSTLVYPLYQPAEEEEFPTTGGQLPRIPHIIHQMYADEMIPDMYINHVKSFIEHNPTWEYRFWTDESGRRLLQKHHPYLVDVYENFGRTVKRSDLLRYAVLYEYGGFYADLDMDNLRSLNITTVKYACIVPVEPFEHSVLLHNREFLMNNAIMSCRPKHPFFKLLLKNLQQADATSHPIETTGPGYVTKQFTHLYYIDLVGGDRNKTDWTSNSPYFYKGEPMEDDFNSVYVPNSQYFMDKLDPTRFTEGAMFEFCVKKLPYRGQRVCSEFYKRKHIRKNKKYTFTEHHWYHLWIMTKTTVSELKKISIRDVVPKCILYNG